jgi:hypothetical protein
MRRRFGRRRWGSGNGGDEGDRGLDPGRELARVVQAGVVPVEALEPVEVAEVPSALAAVGTGTTRDGERVIVGVSPRSGADAWLGAVAVALQRRAEAGFDGLVVAVSPSWPLAARRRLSLLRAGLLRVQARLEPAMPEAAGEVAPEPLESPPGAVEASLREPLAGLFARTGTALAGLAAKHGGALRPAGGGLELVLLGRPAAALRADEEGVVLEAWEPRRELMRLTPDTLSDALDRLEGSLRKMLMDRRLREGEPGLRASLAARLAEAAGLSGVRLWPLAGPAGEGIEFAAVDAEGRPVVGVARGALGLAGLGAALDGWIALAPWLPTLLGDATVRQGRAPVLLVAAEQVDPAVDRVLGALALEVRRFDAPGTGRREAALIERPIAAGPSTPLARPRPARAEPPAREPARAPERAPAPLEEAAPAAPPAPARAAGPESAGRSRFEEFSLFDLAGELGAEEAGGRRRRRRRRGRGRGRVGGGPSDVARAEEPGEEEDESEPESRAEPRPEPARVPREEPRGRGRSRRGRGRGRERQRPAVLEVGEGGESSDEEELEGEEGLVTLAEVPEPTEVEEPAAEAGYEDEEEEEESPEEARLHAEREARRRARIAKTEPEVAPAPPRPPRRRAAFLVHADRESIAAGVLLARETRLIEGIWVYPQADLMTFFRSVATDLREEAPICVIGFTASPARDTLQAASLYRNRLTWYDHHEWPPEDLEGLRRAIGAEAVHVEPTAGGILPAALSACTRRSRFSDKLVDLLVGRFSRHDYERWGRLWWWRLGHIAGRPGERRAELDALIAGRPSDLAREAARAAPAPTPAEAEWVAGRDFRLVHFGGFVLARVPVAPELDPYLTARIVRERYAAALSLAWTEGAEVFVLGGDEGTSRRALDLAAMVDHLAEKFGFVRVLADGDHVARFRIEGAADRPDRIDEVVSEIAMGRSLLEG